MTMQKISACVVTFNDEHTVAWSLSSIPWVDEIVVVDGDIDFVSEGHWQELRT